MPLVGAPTFAPGVLTADQLNSLVELLEAKFAGGITTEDISWPLTAGGNIDMDQFELLHLARLWNTRNLAERASTESVQDVLDDINSEGGGVMLLPSNSTETIGTAGVTVGSNTIIIGEGDTSIFATAGTATNHMFRNKANGNSNIQFINLKLTNTNTGGGAYNIVNMQRVTKMRFTDLTLAVGAENGLVLTSDSAGTSCVDAKFVRVKGALTSGGDNLVLLKDVQDVTIDDCNFTISTNGSAIGFSAVGATSNASKIAIVNNKLDLAYAATASMFSMVGPATTNFLGLNIVNNQMSNSVAASSIHIDVRYAGLGGLHIVDNTILDLGGGASFDAGIRVRTAANFSVESNNISGGTVSILLGADARSGSAATVSDYVCSNNVVTCATGGTCIAFVHNGTSMNCIISENKVFSDSTTTGAFEIWNLAAHPTTLVFSAIITGNKAVRGSSTLGWVNYTGMGTTRGGRAGAANNSYLLFMHNNVQGTVVSGAAGADFDTYTATGAQGIDAEEYVNIYNFL
jgi:hypothetical protein